MFRASLVLALILNSAGALASPRPKISTGKTSPIPNLIDESARLKVLQEETVQKAVSRARMKYGIGYTVMSAKKLELIANERLVRYNDVSRPGLNANIGYFPLNYRGYWGLVGQVSYNYGENSGLVKTALHWMSADISLMYRYEESERALFKPFFALGGGYNVLIQRGPSYYNTSEARGVGVVGLGVNLNLNRTFAFRAPLMWELTAQYRKIIDSEDRNLNFNGEQYALGLELAL